VIAAAASVRFLLLRPAKLWLKLMSEDVAFAPTGEVELRPRREEIETGLRELHTPLTRQHLIEHVLQPVKIGHVIGSIGELLLG
jgi:hypothetical protein